MDSTGTLCVATSTGGITNKLVGRIGDTPTFGAGFWAEQWDELKSPAPPVVSPLDTILSSPLATTLQSCFGGSSSDYTHGMRYEDKKEQPTRKRAVALSGTGNGDAFLRIAAAHTAALIPRLVSSRSLQSSTTQVAGPRGELQRSAGDRWGKTGEGEGGLIGIEYVEGVGGNVVADFNCGGMFRAWVDDFGVGRMRVFRGKYSEEEE